MEDVQAPIHMRRKSGYLNALKVRCNGEGSVADGVDKPQFYQIAHSALV